MFLVMPTKLKSKSKLALAVKSKATLKNKLVLKQEDPTLSAVNSDNTPEITNLEEMHEEAQNDPAEDSISTS